jgi:polysaccharide biosynthesis transport protein
MLQTPKPKPIVERDVALADVASPAELLASVTSFVRRQFPIIVFVTFLTCALGALYVLTASPSYTAQATMIIDTRKVQIFQQPTVIGDNTINAGMVESQVEILRSENISSAVIKELRLTEDPEFINSGGGVIGKLVALFADRFAGSTPSSEFELMRRAISAFADRLTVRRVGLTYIIEISFRSLNPDRAAQVANAIADAYIVDQLEAKYQATKRASTWLQDRIKELREQSSTAQRAVVEFKVKNNIVNTGTDGRLIDDQRVSEVNSQLVIARAQTSESYARLNRIDAVLKADSPDATVDATVADSLKNDVITKLRSQYLDLANREADWSARYGRDHLAAIHLRNQMREIRNSIVNELKRIAETYKSDYEIAKQREEGIRKELAQAVSQSQATNEAQVTLRELESNAQTYRALYDNFLQRYMESVQQQSFPITEARVVTAASRPLARSHPKAFLILAFSGIGGLMMGLGIARLRDLSDRVFRSSSQVEASLHVECLAVLPNIKDQSSQPAAPQIKVVNSSQPVLEHLEERTETAVAGTRIITPTDDLMWHVTNCPLSRFAESIRSIKMAADLDGARKNKILAMTSALPNEGKSTIAASLAQLMAHAGAATILVDGDLRNPSLTRKLTPSAKRGLVEVISGKVSLDDVIWKSASSRLSFVPAVVNPRLFSYTNEILASDAARVFFEGLRESYNYVIVDLSPLAPIVDVRGTSSFVDSYVFVIEWGRTRYEVVQKVLNDSRIVYENMLGAVLNKADIGILSRYEGYGYYYHEKYASRYGYTE